MDKKMHSHCSHFYFYDIKIPSLAKLCIVSANLNECIPAQMDLCKMSLPFHISKLALCYFTAEYSSPV